MQFAIFFLSFFHVPPRPPNLCTKAVAGNVGKELHLKEKENGSCGLALGQLKGPRVRQHDCLGW